jgi:hypothetical protein
MNLQGQALDSFKLLKSPMMGEISWDSYEAHLNGTIGLSA